MSGIMRPRSLRIPVKNSDQEVEVFTDELPDDVNDIMDILRAELAALDIWLQFAVRRETAWSYLMICWFHRPGRVL